MKKLSGLLIFMLLCSHSWAQKKKRHHAHKTKIRYEKIVSADDFYKSTGITDSIGNSKLYSSIKCWLYTKYRYGGHTDKGIDCSGFTKALYSEAFGIQLSGGASASIFQQDVEPIGKDGLQEGDLVFFIIRKKRISHVGVYLGNNKFVHASRHYGVIISSLEDAYYKKRFYKAGRHKTLYLCRTIVH